MEKAKMRIGVTKRHDNVTEFCIIQKLDDVIFLRFLEKRYEGAPKIGYCRILYIHQRH